MFIDPQAFIEKQLKRRILASFILAILSIILLISPILLGDIGSNEDGALLSGLKGNAWLDFLGHFHPLILHLPIGTLVLVFSLEVLRLLTGSKTWEMTLPLAFNAITSVAAAIAGLMWYYGGSYSTSSELLDDHMWQGLWFAAVSLWLPMVYINVKSTKAAILYPITLLLSLLLLISAAHHGGESMHGPLMDRAPWNKKEKNSDEEEKTTETQVDSRVIFTDIVYPILAEKCNACHHTDKKVKSGLKFDTYADIILGGDGQEDFPCLIPGDVKNSSLITFIELPLDDDLHMPPEKKPQVTDDELKILKWWVEIGAPEMKKVHEVTVPAELQPLL